MPAIDTMVVPPEQARAMAGMRTDGDSRLFAEEEARGEAALRRAGGAQ